MPPRASSAGVADREASRRPHAPGAEFAGSARTAFKIVVGDTLALTPPMGWNDWYTYYDRITDKLMREAADVMISSGMADFGYQYVNIDDCWMVKPDVERRRPGRAARATRAA